VASNSLVPPGGTSTTVTQHDVDTGGGDNAGGNITKVTINNKTVTIHGTPPGPFPKLVTLIRKLKAEGPEEKVLQEHIKDLQVFTRTVQNEEVVGLDAKFVAAGRVDQLEMARHLKEIVYAELTQNCFSPAFQNLYAHVLAQIWEKFEAYVVPAIKEGASRREVDELVSTKVIGPVVQQVEECGEESDLSLIMLRGMLYYLTGNCHVKWH